MIFLIHVSEYPTCMLGDQNVPSVNNGNTNCVKHEGGKKKKKKKRKRKRRKERKKERKKEREK